MRQSETSHQDKLRQDTKTSNTPCIHDSPLKAIQPSHWQGNEHKEMPDHTEGDGRKLIGTINTHWNEKVKEMCTIREQKHVTSLTCNTWLPTSTITTPLPAPRKNSHKTTSDYNILTDSTLLHE